MLHTSATRISDFFFFKQKTAYEIRKGDWSSDVCSSDLARRSKSARCSACTGGAIGSARPAPMNTDVPVRSGSGSASKGTMGLKSTAPRTSPTPQEQTPRDVRPIREPHRHDALEIEVV